MTAFKKIWKWSFIITLPVTIVFFYWAYRTGISYYTFGIRYDATPARVILLHTGKVEFDHMVRRFRLALFPPGVFSENKNHLRTINLFIPKSEMTQLNSNLPHSGFDYVRGSLWYGDKVKKVKIRYRGDFLYHWGFYKKSLRIKTKKDNLFEGMRKFNLVVPKFSEHLYNYLGYELARDMGLLAPKAEMVNLAINGKGRGVHLMVEQLDESTLRRNHLMPGDIYSGEIIAKDGYKGLNDNVFEHAGIWEKSAVNNHYPETSRKPLERLIELIHEDRSEDAQNELSLLVDMEKMGTFSAYETLAQTFHFTDSHNFRLYFDPAKSKFIPIVWDPVAWAWRPRKGEKATFDFVTSRFHRALFKNGDFLRARQKAFEKFYARGLDKIFVNKVQKTVSKMIPVIEQDPYIRPVNPDKIISAMKDLEKGIEKVFEDIKEEYVGVKGEVTYAKQDASGAIPIVVSGRRIIKRISFHFSDFFPSPISLKVRYYKNDIPVLIDMTKDARKEGNRVVVDMELPPCYTLPELYKAEVKSAYYEVILENKKTGPIIDIFYDRGVGFRSARRVDHLEKLSFDHLAKVYSPSPDKRPLVWEDDITVSGVMEIKRPLVIKPGTTIKLKPSASLVIYSKVVADGQEALPVRFQPELMGQEPWGTIVLKGKGADGSYFNRCEFRSGSGLKGDLFEYSGMFSVHDVSNVTVKNCIFEDNRIVDDMVHVVYSNISFSDSVFKGALSDALDLDICDAVIDHCRFLESGNDGVDLMTSNAVIMNSYFFKNNDKGISVGENSVLLAINDIFSENTIGIQSKDESTAVLYNVDLNANKNALYVYRKNWRYQRGGTIYAYKSRVTNNKDRLCAKKKSAIYLYDSYVDEAEMEEQKRIVMDKSVDSISKTRANSSEHYRYPDEIERLKRMNGMDTSSWGNIDPETRGDIKIIRN